MFSSTHERLTRTSSDLRLLAATLCPPSPILTPEDLLSPSTSGEIPLIIDFVIDDTPSPLLFEYGTDVCTPLKARRLESNAAVTEPPMAASSSFPSLVSPYSINESLLDEVFFTPKSSRSSQSLDPTPSPSPNPSSSFRFQLAYTRSSALPDSVGSPLSDSSSTRTVLGSINRLYSGRICNAASTAPGEDGENEAQTVFLGSLATFSTLPTPCFAPPSASPSMDVISPISLTYSRRHRKPLERSGAIHHPKMIRSIPRSPRLLLHSRELNEPTSSDADSEHTTHWQLIDFPTISPIHPWASACTTSNSPTTYPYLPHDLSWLGGTEVELWIEQEGFRSIRPMMRLMGYSPRSRSLLPYDDRSITSDVGRGVAEFMPVKRESFAFHHATLDGPPMLRRVTVGGDDSRDYLSRHAALNIRTSGVYTVLGSESMVLGGSQEHVKTQWKFDYLVHDNDRQIDDSGRILSGEKIITPLTFSCSPFLLHPLQGKKVGFMHTMKKSVVPRLSSERLEPPAPERFKNVESQPLSRMASLRRTGTHRPSRSEVHANPRGGALVGSYSPLGPSNGGRFFEGTKQMQYTRRRRASSAVEQDYMDLHRPHQSLSLSYRR